MWDGDVGSRIRVTAFAWQKRRTTKAPRRLPSVPWRTFAHEDGREWRIAGLNNAVCLRIKDQDGEVVERRTPAARSSMRRSAALGEGAARRTDSPSARSFGGRRDRRAGGGHVALWVRAGARSRRRPRQRNGLSVG